MQVALPGGARPVTYDGHVGYGLYEHGFFGPFPRYGMTDAVMGAPG